MRRVGTILAAGIAGVLVALIGVVPASAGTIRYICARDVYVRDAPAGVVIGTLYNGERFELSRYSPSHNWAEGYAMGSAQKRGWILSSAMCPL